MRLFSRRSRPKPMHPDLRPVPDDLPRGMFVEPLVVAALRAAEPESLDEQVTRVTFRATIKDAEGKRCPDLAVEATVTGPDRTATGMGHTDLMGNVKFRMTGPSGTYAIRIDDVAGGALSLDRDASILTAEATVA